jgi:mRNA-degrading endonuclease RelE of RelBE toxin-antitoxin system
MRYEIDFAADAEADLNRYRAYERVAILDRIEKHLRYEPTHASQSRIKALRGLARPQYRLRIGDIRVFYDVHGKVVEIIAIVDKAPDQLHKVLQLMRTMPFVHIRRQMGDNGEFNPICNLYVCVADYKNYRLGYEWAKTMGEVKKGRPGPEFFALTFAMFRMGAVPVLVDPAAISDYRKYRGSTCITPNRTEASLATGTPSSHIHILARCSASR